MVFVKDIEMTAKKVFKNIETSLGIINDILSENTYSISGGTDFMDKKVVNVTKQEKQFKLSFILPWSERRYFNDVFDKHIREYSLTAKSGLNLIAQEKSTLINGQKEVNADYGEGYIDFEITASLSQFSDIALEDFENKYHRVLIPVEDDKFSFRDFQHYWYDSDLKVSHRELIKVQIGDMNFHFFIFNYFGKYYWAIDSLQNLEFRKFQEIAFTIFNTYGFIKGNLYLNEAFYFSCESKDFDNELHFYYSSMRDSLITHISMFTTNSYSVLVPAYKKMGKEFTSEDAKPWLEKLAYFSDAVFSKLAELFYTHDSISRAALIVLEANKQALELKAASYCVAYEAVCHTIKKLITIDSSNVIDDKTWDDAVKPKFEEELQSIHKQGIINDDQKRILINKLNNWNQPTNRDSLTAPFTFFNYNLSSEEYRCIDNRNKFLHGSIPVKSNDTNVLFNQLYYISLTIHRLLYILVFKYVGFDGYIINYLKLHEHMTNRNCNEEGFLKI